MIMQLLEDVSLSGITSFLCFVIILKMEIAKSCEKNECSCLLGEDDH